MIILITLVALFAVFFLIRKHIGATMLAVIAGLSIFDTFGKTIVENLCKLVPTIDASLATTCIYFALIVTLPIVLYFRSSRGGLFGILRIFEAAVLAAILASLAASQLTHLVPFDQLSLEILAFINSIKGPILLGGIAVAYFDILFYRNVD